MTDTTSSNPVAAILRRHRLVDVDDGPADDTVVARYLENHGVWFDAEMIHRDEDYGDLLLQFARATKGEWVPVAVRSRRDPAEEVAGVEFVHGDEHLCWEFPDSGSDRVAGEFLDHVGAFAGDRLSGDFVDLDTGDQTARYVYLPRPAAAELELVPWEQRTVPVEEPAPGMGEDGMSSAERAGLIAAAVRERLSRLQR